MTELKYNLNKLLGEVERNISIRDIEKMLEDQFGINAVTFRRHRSIVQGSDQAIREDTLAFYAKFFSKKPEELRNYKLRKGKSLMQLKLEKSGQPASSESPLFDQK